MSELQEISVDLLPDGTVKVEIRGVRGKKCLEITKDMEQLLGGEVVSQNLTDEYDLQDDTQDDLLTETL